MQAAAFPAGGFTFLGTTPERASQPIGKFFGLLGLEWALGTGSERIVIREQRAEFVKSRAVCDESGLAPDIILRRLRKVTGLTWEELSIAMSVSKRSLHLWDAGQPLSQKHLAHLHRIAGLIDRLQKGSPVHMRNLLLKDIGGQNCLTLLREGRYGQVEQHLASAKSSPLFAELPAGEFKKRLPSGVSLASYSEINTPASAASKPLKGIKAPKLRKG